MFNLEEKIKKYLKNISKDRVVTDFFRNIIKPFLANTTHFNGKEIILIIDKETITNNTELAEIFKTHNTNIAKKISGKKQLILIMAIFLILRKL